MDSDRCKSNKEQKLYHYRDSGGLVLALRTQPRGILSGLLRRLLWGLLRRILLRGLLRQLLLREKRRLLRGSKRQPLHVRQFDGGFTATLRARPHTPARQGRWKDLHRCEGEAADEAPASDSDGDKGSSLGFARAHKTAWIDSTGSLIYLSTPKGKIVSPGLLKVVTCMMTHEYMGHCYNATLEKPTLKNVITETLHCVGSRYAWRARPLLP
jgi:hypothetical protein